MGRAPCCDKANVKKGPWSPEEDSKLKEYIEKNGTGGNWIALPQKAGLKRCGKSCRLRWLNYLRPNIKHGEFSDEEDRIICTLFASIGSRWSIIAAQLPGRTDNDIKNYWNTKLKKKLMAMAPNSQRKPPPFPSSNHTHHHQTLPFPSPYSCSSYVYPSTTNTNKPFPTFDPLLSQISSPTLLGNNNGSILATNSSSCSLLFQKGMATPSPMQYSNLLVFGSEGSCSSNSDGSCSQISYGGGGKEVKQEENIGFQSYISSGFEENNSHKFMLSYDNNNNNNSNNGGGENLAQGYFGESTMGDYAILEDVKQLISTTCSNNNNFLIDENKTLQQQHQRDEKAMYYYYY